MNRIFNWTFGSIFRTIGRVIAYILIGSIFALILSKSGLKIVDYIPFGIVRVSAKSVSITSQSYSIRHINMNSGDYIWTSYVSNGTQTTINTDTYYTRGVRTKFYSSGKFEKDIQYQAKVKVNSTPKGTYSSFYPGNELSCYGSLSNSSYNPQTSLISACQLVAVVVEDGNNFTDYYINFTPVSNIETIQFVILWNYNHPITRINVDSSSTITYDTSTQDSINQQTNSLIDNQNSNTNQIIDNQNSNTEQIINNQNELLGNKCANLFNKNDITTGYTFNNSGGTTSLSNSFIGNTFIYVSNGETKVTIGTINNYTSTQDYRLIINEYDSNLEWIKRTLIGYPNVNATITLTSSTKYIKIGASTVTKDELMVNWGSSLKSYCEYGTYTSKQDTTNQELNNINDSLNDDDSSEAQNKASEFFGNFTTNTHGLTGIITAPLNAINSLASSTCSPLVLPLPFVNQNLTLPCMRQIYVDNFGSFMTIYDVITLGIVSYWILVRIFALVKDFKNPDHDEIEVMDL